MLWSILIPTHASRRDKFTGLMSVLLPQVEHTGGQVEIVACHNFGVPSLASIRQKLMESAAGDYVSFVDDDDMVPSDFVQALRAALMFRPDVVAFNVEYTCNGGPPVMTFCSIEHEARDTPEGLFRNLTHVQPLKKELALKGDFRAGWPEDSSWRAQVEKHVVSEIYVPAVLYYYRHNTQDSVQSVLQPVRNSTRPEVESPCFRWIEA